MELHTMKQWSQIELLQIERMRQESEKEKWSYKLAEKARQAVRNAFNKYKYLKSRYRDNIQVFKDVCLNLSGTKILASLREFKNIVKLLVSNTRAWEFIPSGERDLIIKAARLAGVMVMVPAWIMLSNII